MLEEVIIPELIPELIPKLVRQNGIIENVKPSEFDAFRMLNNTDEKGIPYDWIELMEKLDTIGLYDGYLNDVFDFYEDLHPHFDSYTNFLLACSHFSDEELKLKTANKSKLLRKVKRILANTGKKDSEIMNMLNKTK